MFNYISEGYKAYVVIFLKIDFEILEHNNRIIR